jgi:hypothetical protein
MTTISDRSQIPSEVAIVTLPVVNLVESLGFKWELRVQHPTPDPEKRVQIRDEKHHAPRSQVVQYREAMKRGTLFPPVVLSSDGFLVDGNTRTKAAQNLGFPTMLAILLDRAWEGQGPEHQKAQNRMKMLGAGFNTRNGKGIDREEIQKVINFVGPNAGYDATRIAALLNVTAATVTSYFAEKKARDRSEEVGVHFNGSIPASTLRLLGQAPINDRPFKALAELVQDSGMKAREVQEVIQGIKKARDDDASLKLIEEQRVTRTDQIAEYKASGKSKPPAAAQLRQRLGYIFNLDSDLGPGSMVEHSPSLMRQHLGEVERAVEILRAVAGLQERAIQ